MAAFGRAPFSNTISGYRTVGLCYRLYL